MAYTKTVWVNDTVPSINADNLNKIEQGIYDAHQENSDLKSHLDAVDDKLNPVFIPVDIAELDWQEGYVKWNNGNPTAAASNGSCKVSSPILLRKGQTVIVNCSGYLMVTSIINKVLRIGNTPQVSYYQPLIRDVGTVDHQYLYTATEDIYVSLTYYYGGNVPISVSIIHQIDKQYENIKNVRLDKSFLTDMRVYATTGFNTYANWFSSDFISLENIKELVYIRSNSFTAIYMVAFFDENQSFISGELPTISINDVETIYTDIIIPSNAKYFRIASCIAAGLPVGILGYIEKTTALLSKKIDLTNRILSKNLWLGTTVTSEYVGWYSTDYIDLDNVKKIKKVSTIGHTLLNGLTLFDADKNTTRGFTATENNNHYILEDIELLPNEKYAVVSWGEIVIDGALAKSSDIDFLIELIEPEPTAEDYSYLVSQFDNILCIGDSLTCGDYGSIPEGTPNTHEKNYPHYLARYLNTNVVNQGVNGTYPRWWWNNKSRIDLTIDYDCIFFFLGTNFGLTDTIAEDTASGDYNTYADTETGRYCSMIEWLEANIPNAKIFLISFPHNYRDWIWYIKNLPVLYKIAEKYNLPVVDMTVDVPFTRYNGDIYRPVGYNPNGDTLPEKYGNLHFGTLGYQTFAEYLIRNTGKVMSENLIEYKGKLD